MILNGITISAISRFSSIPWRFRWLRCYCLIVRSGVRNEMFAGLRVATAIVAMFFGLLVSSFAHCIEANSKQNLPFMSVDLIVVLGWSVDKNYSFLIETTGYIRKAPALDRLFLCDSMDDVWHWDCLRVSVQLDLLRKGFEFEVDKRYRLHGVVGPDGWISRVGIDLWGIQEESAVPDVSGRPREIDSKLPSCAVNDGVDIPGSGMHPLAVLAAGPPSIRNTKIATAGYLAKGMNSFICRTKGFHDCIRLCGGTGTFGHGERVFVSGIFVVSEAPALILIDLPVGVVPRKWFF